MNDTVASETVSVSILDREFLVACNRDERPALIAAASYLDGKMRDVRGGGSVTGYDRIAVLAALTITHEMLEARANGASESSDISRHLLMLRSKLDAALPSSLQ